MRTTAARRRPDADAVAGSAFVYVQSQLEALIADFGLDVQKPAVLAVFRAIFRSALDFPLGGRPPGRSRLNEDGMPIQFATATGVSPAPLRFVGDVGPLDGLGHLRMRNAFKTMEDVARILSVEAEFEAAQSLLETLAPKGNRALRDDPAGAFWIAAAFAPMATPRMQIYVNSRWGNGNEDLARLRAFAAHFGADTAWAATEERLPTALSPLGFAVTLARGRPAKGAIYFRAFGLRLADYVALLRAGAGAPNADAIKAFGTVLLGGDALYPTASSVLSFGFGVLPGPGLTADLEFCGHCLFADDAEARRRLLCLIAAAGHDAAPYRALDAILARGAPTQGPPMVHSFVGVDTKSRGLTYTIYMKPYLFR